MAACNCLPGGKPNPVGRCPVHHPLDPRKPDPYLRSLYAGRINHLHHENGKLVWEGPPESCPHCKELARHQAS
jgi:hypothetical protein